MTERIWLTVADAAERAGVGRDTVYTAVERGELRHVRVGGRRSIRFKADWVDAWLERHAKGPEETQGDIGQVIRLRGR